MMRTPEQQARDALRKALETYEIKLKRKREELKPLEEQVARLNAALTALDPDDFNELTGVA